MSMRPEDQRKIIEWFQKRITRLESSSNYSQIRPGVERLKTFTAKLVEEWNGTVKERRKASENERNRSCNQNRT